MSLLGGVQMVKTVKCRVIRTVPAGGFNSRSGGSPAGERSSQPSADGNTREVADVPSGPYDLFGNVTEGIVIDFLA